MPQRVNRSLLVWYQGLSICGRPAEARLQLSRVSWRFSSAGYRGVWFTLRCYSWCRPAGLHRGTASRYCFEFL